MYYNPKKEERVDEIEVETEIEETSALPLSGKWPGKMVCGARGIAQIERQRLIHLDRGCASRWFPEDSALQTCQ
jgi:hypothetical protein